MTVEYQNINQQINQVLQQERGWIMQKNIQKNQKLIQKNGGLKPIVAELANQHVIICGAGPSLVTQLATLRSHCKNQQIKIIATDMALRPLLENGIKPDYCITCETRPFAYFCQLATEKIHLLAFCAASPSNLHQWQGKISFYNWLLKGEFFENLWQASGIELGSVATASLVTTQAVSLALGCSIKSLLLLGNDLAYQHEFYLKETARFVQNLETQSRLNPLHNIEKERGRAARIYQIQRGEKIYSTNNQFLAAKNWLEELFQKVNIPIYDSSEPGCSPQIVEHLAADEYFKKIKKAQRRRR